MQKEEITGVGLSYLQRDRDYSSTLHPGRKSEEPGEPPIASPPFIPLEIGPLNAIRGSGEGCKLSQRGLGRSPISRNQI